AYSEFSFPSVYLKGIITIDFVRHFLNAVLFNQFSQNFIRIYGQSPHFHRFVRKRQRFRQMQRPLNSKELSCRRKNPDDLQ
ncbi:MAG: hypothetical protein ACIRZ1_06870, partial [Ligilactobacillus ruminis]